MSKLEVTLGIDIGGTNTKLGFVDREGNTLAESSIPTHSEKPATDFVAHLHKAIQALWKTLPVEVELKGIGMGAPNANYYRGTVERPPNLSWGDETPLVAMIKKHYNVPIVITNDANAAALGEMKFGVAQAMKNFIMITLGTGLGSGIVVNGELVYGHDGFAGELGHTIVNINGRHCGCGRRGCLETYVSATGIRRTVYKLLADYTEDSEMRRVSFDDLSAEMITEAALRGDKIAIEAFEYTSRILAMKLADAVAHTSPEAIILFGGLTRAGQVLFAPTQKYLESYLMNIYKGKIKLIRSGIMDKNVAVLGASALIWNELEKAERLDKTHVH
jgi:glucokinase